MSGTSLDGLDLVACRFNVSNNQSSFEIIDALTVPYEQKLLQKLANIHNVLGDELIQTDFLLGRFIGQKIREFVSDNHFSPDFIGSHGHTAFHFPARGYTCQIGNGQAIVEESGIPVINDFRSRDLLKGGQGAPLVPAAEADLFSEYDFCLNLGGIANVTCLNGPSVRAYDVAPCNLILNKIAGMLGKDFDKDGKIASSGVINEEFLQKLNGHPYYERGMPKSLDKEEVLEQWWPVFTESGLSPGDMSATFCRHLTGLIEDSVMFMHQSSEKPSVLITGGGTMHPVLMKYFNNSARVNFEIPGMDLIEFKEALAFAYLGLQKLLGRNNVLSSVTGAYEDHCSGVVHGDLKALF